MYTYTRLLEPDQISHTQSMVAKTKSKRDLTNRANVHTPPYVKKKKKKEESRLKHSTAEFQSI